MHSGKAFELEVSDLLRKEHNSGALGIPKESARLFVHKDYYSCDRGRPLIVDISIEFYRRQSAEAYLRWVWECKDLSRQVGVEEIEDFHAKLEQIVLHKTKGTVVSRLGFQRSALEYSKSKGIGLARVISHVRLKTILEFPRSPSTQFIEAQLVEPAVENVVSPFSGLSTIQRPAASLRDLFVLELASALNPTREEFHD